MMSNAIQVISEAKDKFQAIVSESPEINVKWQTESMFAMQAVTKNQHIQNAAINNPQSLRNAVINVASVGLSLNPATAYAYLVPRDGAICLDVSYKGLIKIATDTGSIMWAKADVVYSSDMFEYNGPAMPPTHKADVFSKDRGEVVGVYCIAKTCEGDYLIETMSEDEIKDIRNKSKSASSSYSPWNTFPNEMRKKAVIKRASKTWPKTEKHAQLDKVIEYVNNEEGIDFNEPKDDDIKMYGDFLHQKNGAALRNLYNENTEYWTKIEATFYEKGKKGAFNAMLKEMMNDAEDYIRNVTDTILEAAGHDDNEIALEAYNEMNEHELKLFWHRIQPADRITVENIINEQE